MIEVNGMAHVILTVSQYGAAKAFYGRLMPALGLENVFDGENMCYFVGARTALGCLLYTSPSPRDATLARMPSSA